MEEQNKILSIAEKIKAIAMVSIGSGIFSMGSTYFTKQSMYHIPRILLPIFEIFGNIGLAIGMLILGVMLMYFAFLKFKKNNSKSTTFLIYLMVSIITFYGIILTTNKKPSTRDIENTIEKNKQKVQNKIQNSERPNIQNAKVNLYFDKMEALLMKYKKAKETNSKTYFDECENEHTELISIEFSNAMKEVINTDKQKDFILYNAKLANQIEELSK